MPGAVTSSAKVTKTVSHANSVAYGTSSDGFAAFVIEQHFFAVIEVAYHVRNDKVISLRLATTPSSGFVDVGTNELRETS